MECTTSYALWHYNLYPLVKLCYKRVYLLSIICKCVGTCGQYQKPSKFVVTPHLVNHLQHQTSVYNTSYFTLKKLLPSLCMKIISFMIVQGLDWEAYPPALCYHINHLQKTHYIQNCIIHNNSDQEFMRHGPWNKITQTPASIFPDDDLVGKTEP